MLVLVIRAMIIYIIVIMVFRLMGKRQIGQMQPFEFVLTLIIADLVTIPMGNSSIPLLHGIISLLTLATIHFLITLLTRKNKFLSQVISGKPVIVVNPDGIDYENLKKLNISLDDLFESIRGCGYFSLDEVEYAIIETNGLVNVLTKKDFSPLTIGDVSKTKSGITINQSKEKTIPITLVSEGSMNKENIKAAELNEVKIDEILKKAGTKNIKDILVITIDGNGKVYSQLKNEHFKVFNIDYKKEVV